MSLIPFMGAGPLALAKEAAPVASSFIEEGGATIRHSREHPLPLPTKSSQASTHHYSLFTYAPTRIDNRDMSNSTNVSDIPETTFDKVPLGKNAGKGADSSAVIAAGLGVAAAAVVSGGVYLYNKAYPKERLPLEPRRATFESGRIVGEEYGDGEEGVEEGEEEEEEEYVDLSLCK